MSIIPVRLTLHEQIRTTNWLASVEVDFSSRVFVVRESNVVPLTVRDKRKVLEGLVMGRIPNVYSGAIITTEAIEISTKWNSVKRMRPISNLGIKLEPQRKRNTTRAECYIAKTVVAVIPQSYDIVIPISKIWQKYCITNFPGSYTWTWNWKIRDQSKSKQSILNISNRSVGRCFEKKMTLLTNCSI